MKQISIREMYRSTARVQYPRGEKSMYSVIIRLKTGKLIKLPFYVEGKRTPYDFVVKFVNEWIFYTNEIKFLELLSHEGKYLESYDPVYGWFKRKEEPEKE